MAGGGSNMLVQIRSGSSVVIEHVNGELICVACSERLAKVIVQDLNYASREQDKARKLQGKPVDLLAEFKPFVREYAILRYLANSPTKTIKEIHSGMLLGRDEEWISNFLETVAQTRPDLIRYSTQFYWATTALINYFNQT